MVILLKTEISSIANTSSRFRVVTPHGQPEKWTQTKKKFVEGQDVRIDKFPWLNLDDRETIRQSPVHQFIEARISSARLAGHRSDDFDHDDYQMYDRDYDRRYGPSALEKAYGSRHTEHSGDLTVNAHLDGFTAESYDDQLVSLSCNPPGQGTKRKGSPGLTGRSKRQKRNIPKLSKDQWIKQER